VTAARNDHADTEDTPPGGILRLVRELPTDEAIVHVAAATERAVAHSHAAEVAAHRAREASERTEAIAHRTRERVDACVEIIDRTAAQVLTVTDDLEARVVVETGRLARRLEKVELRIALLSAGGTGAVTVVAELIRGLLQ
jgi:hypothetical protein